VDRACSWLFFLGKDILYKKVVGFLPLCRRVSQDIYVMLRGGTSRCLWFGGDGATSPMEKQACKRSLNCYGKSNVNGNSTPSSRISLLFWSPDVGLMPFFNHAYTIILRSWLMFDFNHAVNLSACILLEIIGVLV
jgi:hypothetical protein